jgi:hypothetical protein
VDLSPKVRRISTLSFSNLAIALKAIYPEYNWDTVRESQTLPSGHWEDLANQRAFFDQLAIKCNIQKPEQWLFIHSDYIFKNGGSFIRRYYSGSITKGKRLVAIVSQ